MCIKGNKVKNKNKKQKQKQKNVATLTCGSGAVAESHVVGTDPSKRVV